MARLLEDLFDVSRLTRGQFALRLRAAGAAGRDRACARDRPARGSTSTGTRFRSACRPEPLPGRRRHDAAGAGVLQPAHQRRQVHPGRRPAGPDDGGGRRRGRGAGQRQRHRHFRRADAAPVRDVHPGRFADRSRRRAAWASACRSPAAWSRCTAAGSAAHSAGLGLGSEFVVRLPLARTPADARAGATARGAGRSRGGRALRVLVADDLRDSADSLGLLIELMGHRGRGRLRRRGGAARGGAPSGPTSSCSTSACRSSTASRSAAASATAPWGASVRLVAQSGWGQDEDRRRTAEAGFDHHIVKPIDPAALEVLMQTLGAARSRRLPRAPAGRRRTGGGRRIARRRPTTPLGK